MYANRTPPVPIFLHSWGLREGMHLNESEKGRHPPEGCTKKAWKTQKAK